MIVFAVAVLATACSGTAAQTTVSSPPAAQPEGPDVLATVGSGAHLAVGVNAHLLWSQLSASDRNRILDTLAGAGAEWIRVDVGWATVEEGGRGTVADWYLTKLEATVNGARSRGMRVWAMLWGTPDWARDGGDVANPPRDVSDYADVARKLAARFAGRISVWELWNEANTDGFFTGSPREYADLYRAGAAAVRGADPTARISLAGLSLAATKWLDGVLGDLGDDAQSLVDIVSVHPYPVPADAPPDAAAGPAGSNLGGLDAVHDVMKDHGLDVPVVVGELGWSTHDNTSRTTPETRGVTEDEQARYVREALDTVAAQFPFVAAVFLYDDRDTDVPDVHQANFGLLARDLSPKPALAEIRTH